MGKGWLIDSNAVIEFLAGMLPREGEDRIVGKLEEGGIFLSVINQIELLGYSGVSDEITVIKAFVSTCQVLPLSDSIVGLTIELRRSHRIKVPDAIIAATAMDHGLTLITRNTKDFKGIEKLEVVNLHG